MVGQEILSWSFPVAFEPFAVTHAGHQSWGGVKQCKGQNRDERSQGNEETELAENSQR